MLGAAFKMRLRQTEGLIASIITLMGLVISAPDHATASRRAVTLPVVRSTRIPVAY
jgi:Transposase DDE domain